MLEYDNAARANAARAQRILYGTEPYKVATMSVPSGCGEAWINFKNERPTAPPHKIFESTSQIAATDMTGYLSLMYAAGSST